MYEWRCGTRNGQGRIRGVELDEMTARRTAKQLLGKKVGGWAVGEYIDAGKSAFVCRGNRGEEECAIKIFGRDIEELGRDELKERIDRQLELIGNEHENLIRIFGGGYCEEAKCFFLVMEFVEAPNLKQVLNEVPRDKIWSLISQVASAAKHLEKLQLAHRDIKPANILIERDYCKAILLDLGVVLPMGGKSLTDKTNIKPFIGTLQYSSPEYLLREEQNTEEGWRGVTFYQLGAVLHDMIMRYPIFQDQTSPYGRLVQAVCHRVPKVRADDVDSEMIHLVEKCLIKDPIIRIKYVKWEDFEYPKEQQSDIDLVKNRIKSRKDVSGGYAVCERTGEDEKRRSVEQRIYDLGEALEAAIREICIGSSSFPRVRVERKEDGQNDVVVHMLFEQSETSGLGTHLTMVVKASLLDLESNAVQVKCVGVLSDETYLGEPKVMTEIFEDIFNYHVIKEKLDEVIHELFDRGQGYFEAEGDCCDTDNAGKACTLIMIDNDEEDEA